MPKATLADITAAEWDALASRRIFFGHQSVGRNIVDGMRSVLESHPEIRLRLVTAENPSQVEGAAFIDAEIGENRHPATKTSAFAEILRGGFGSEPGAVAMYKYCYVDVQPGTDAEQLFQDYVSNSERLKAEYPGLTIVHVTLPLKTAPTGMVERVKTFLGMDTETALNLIRNRYNELLRERYAGMDPVFDLALIESTRADGSLAFSEHGGRRIYMLAPEWTNDGGHLNEAARRRVGERLLVFLAQLPGAQVDVAQVSEAAGSAE